MQVLFSWKKQEGEEKNMDFETFKENIAKDLEQKLYEKTGREQSTSRRV